MMTIKELLARINNRTAEDWQAIADYEGEMDAKCEEVEKETGNPTFWSYSSGIWQLVEVDEEAQA